MPDKPTFRTITLSVPADTRVLELHEAVAAYFAKIGQEVHVPQPLAWFVRPLGYKPGEELERIRASVEAQRKVPLAPLSATDEADATDAGVREVVA